MKRNQEVNVTIEDLKNQWDEQNGVCVFSGVKLVLSSYTKIEKDPIFSASLDRVDSSKGYITGNIRWVSRTVNWMKNNMEDETVWKFINILVENKRGSN